MSWYKQAIDESPMPKRTLGKTGFKAGILSLGGQGCLEHPKKGSLQIDIIRRALDLGVNYFDTSPIYGDGSSEKYYGQALKNRREQVFLASKTDIRDRDGSLREIEKTLKRLNTHYLDLWQIHHLDEMDEVDQVTGKNGALEALIEMQEQKVVRHLGITGHQDPNVLLEIMRRYPFDTVLCPVNPCDIHMSPPFLTTVIKEANRQNMGVIGMKIFAQGYVFQPGKIETIWEPINYALSQPVSTVIVGCDNIQQLEENVRTAKASVRLDEKEIASIEDKARGDERKMCFFRKEFGGYDSKDELGAPMKPKTKR